MLIMAPHGVRYVDNLKNPHNTYFYLVRWCPQYGTSFITVSVHRLNGKVAPYHKLGFSSGMNQQKTNIKIFLSTCVGVY